MDHIQCRGMEIMRQNLPPDNPFYSISRSKELKGTSTSQNDLEDKNRIHLIDYSYLEENKFLDETARFVNIINERAKKMSDMETDVLEFANYEKIKEYAKNIWKFSRTTRKEYENRRNDYLNKILGFETQFKIYRGQFKDSIEKRKNELIDSWTCLERNEISLQDAMNERLESFFRRNYYSHSLATIIWALATISGFYGLQRYYLNEKKIASFLLFFSPTIQLSFSIILYSWLGIVTCGIGWLLIFCLILAPFVFIFQFFDVFFINYEIFKRNDEIIPKGKPFNLQKLNDSFELEDGGYVYV